MKSSRPPSPLGPQRSSCLCLWTHTRSCFLPAPSPRLRTVARAGVCCQVCSEASWFCTKHLLGVYWVVCLLLKMHRVGEMPLTVGSVVFKALWVARDRNPLAKTEKGDWWKGRMGPQTQGGLCRETSRGDGTRASEQPSPPLSLTFVCRAASHCVCLCLCFLVSLSCVCFLSAPPPSLSHLSALHSFLQLISTEWLLRARHCFRRELWQDPWSPYSPETCHGGGDKKQLSQWAIKCLSQQLLGRR